MCLVAQQPSQKPSLIPPFPSAVAVHKTKPHTAQRVLSPFFITPLSSVNLRLNAHVCALIANACALPYKREVPYPVKLSSLWAAQVSLLLCRVQAG